MRFAAFFFLFVATATSAGQDPKTEKGGPMGPKYVLDFTEKAYGLAFKSAKLEGNEHVILLEFIRDASSQQELRAIQSAVRPSTVGDFKSPSIQFYFFDSDNVVLGKQHVSKTEGEITGRKGDTFRVMVRQLEPATNSRFRTPAKIEARSWSRGPRRRLGEEKK